jgi:ferric-dicitrate binding protein FerR (iron transport regulator)
MDFERLERAWRSPANTPAQAAAAYLTEEVMDALKQRRRSFHTLTAIAGIALVLWTGKIVWDWFANPFPFDLANEWGAVAMLVLPWIALFIARAQFARHLNAYPDPEASMPQALRALIDENRMARRRVQVMAVMMGLGVAALAVALGQLVEVGKMTPDNVRDGAMLFGGVFGVIWGWIGVNYFTRLKPEGERLNRLLAEYAE